MEVYAGIISNLDDNVGRLMAALDRLGVLENTLVLVFSDNGASPEGTETGTPNLFASIFGREVPLEQTADLYDVMGEEQTFPHYPIGWACASNTPYRKYKQYVHLGGVADPLIVSWPKHIEDAGAIRRQFVHVVDLFPTLLEAAKIDRSATYQGRPQKPLEGASAFATLRAADGRDPAPNNIMNSAACARSSPGIGGLPLNMNAVNLSKATNGDSTTCRASPTSSPMYRPRTRTS